MLKVGSDKAHPDIPESLSSPDAENFLLRYVPKMATLILLQAAIAVNTTTATAAAANYGRPME